MSPLGSDATVVELAPPQPGAKRSAQTKSNLVSIGSLERPSFLDSQGSDL